MARANDSSAEALGTTISVARHAQAQARAQVLTLLPGGSTGERQRASLERVLVSVVRYARVAY